MYDHHSCDTYVIVRKLALDTYGNSLWSTDHFPLRGYTILR